MQYLIHFHVISIFRPRETNAFQIMVNVAAMEKVLFELTYQELLKRTKGKYSHVIYVNPGQVVDDMIVEVAIKESRDLTSLKVPPIRNDTLTNYNIESECTKYGGSFIVYALVGVVFVIHLNYFSPYFEPH